jgi:hypothetical protein
MVATGVSAGVVIPGVHCEAHRALIEADCTMYVRKARRRHERHGELAENMIDLSRPALSRATS